MCKNQFVCKAVRSPTFINPLSFTLTMANASAIFALARKEGRLVLTEMESKEVLSAHGIRSVPGLLCKSEKEALSAAKKLGFPVVAKVVSHSITHKTNAGGVFLNLKSESDVSNAYNSILKNASKANAKVEGIAIEKQSSGIEAFIGVKKDAQFGPVVAFGLGGIFVELYHDVSMRVAPLDRSDAEEMLSETKAKKLLDGFRGAKPKDTKSLISLLLKVSSLALAQPEISELDLNPVFVRESGCDVADARIILEK